MRGRRRFVAECGRAALALPLLSLAGCSRQASTTPAPKDAASAGDGWDELVADLEKQLPALLAKATTVPANWRSDKEPLAMQFIPGARWSYSGEGYSYLQAVMTHLTGHVDANHCKTLFDGFKACATDFDGNMKANLFVPFGMTSSGYFYQEGMARPHNEKGVMIADRKATAIEAARYGSAGELHTTPTDYARFLIELLDPKPSDQYRLTTASLQEMVRPQAKITDSLSWGLGWAIEHKKSGGDLISHSGDNPGFKAMTAASLEKKAAFIMMTNGDLGFDIITKVVMSEPMQRFLPVTLG